MSNWKDICSKGDILGNTGRCALLNGEQVAIFHVQSGDGAWYALNNHCPFSEANVLSRGIVGSMNDKTVVASPIYKQHFDLETGACLEDESVAVKTYKVRVDGDTVQLAC